jgi:hypothetical protein
VVISFSNVVSTVIMRVFTVIIRVSTIDSTVVIRFFGRYSVIRLRHTRVITVYLDY